MQHLLFGIPVGPEVLLVVLLAVLIPIALAYWVYQDASARGDEHAMLWAGGMVVLTLVSGVGAIVLLVIYLVQRD